MKEVAPVATSIVPAREIPGEQKDVRAQLERRLPRWIQPLLTRISGRPRFGENPLISPPTAALVLSEGVTLAAAIAVGMMPFEGYLWALPLLPYAIFVAIGRLRWFQTELAHFAIHGVIQRRRLCEVLGTVVPFALNEQDYVVDHFKHHKLSVFGTGEDPDAKFLGTLGFDESKTEKELMDLLIRTAWSPKFHFGFLRARIKSNLVTPGPLRRLLALAWLIGLLALLFVMPLVAWLIMIVGVFTVGYQLSALLQFTSEHLWLTDPPDDTPRSVALSHGRFCAEPPPPSNAGPGAWVRWGARMMFVHLPARLAVLPGSLPAHDAHHVSQRKVDPNWRRAIYVRTELIRNREDKGMGAREVWGLGNATRAVFRSMARPK